LVGGHLSVASRRDQRSPPDGRRTSRFQAADTYARACTSCSSASRAALFKKPRQWLTIANKGATIPRRSSRLDKCALALLHGHSAASATSPARTGFNSMYRAAAIARRTGCCSSTEVPNQTHSAGLCLTSPLCGPTSAVVVRDTASRLFSLRRLLGVFSLPTSQPLPTNLRQLHSRRCPCDLRTGTLAHARVEVLQCVFADRFHRRLDQNRPQPGRCARIRPNRRDAPRDVLETTRLVRMCYPYYTGGAGFADKFAGKCIISAAVS
jgi:hypothetical protein